MGADISKNHPPVKAPSDYMCILFKIPDKVQIVNGSQEDYDVIYRSIKNTWKDGIQAVNRLCTRSVLFYKLKGLPFETGILSENIREVVCQVVINLHKRGWNHLVSTNLTCNRDLFTFIFVKGRPVELGHLGYLSISSHSKLQFVDLKAGTFSQVLEAVKRYHLGIDVHSDEAAHNHDLVITGAPWSSLTNCHAQVRNLLVEIMAIIQSSHEFICTMNVKRTQDTFLFRPKHSDDPTQVSDFLLITLRKTEKLQVYSAPDDAKDALHQTITETLETIGVGVERTIDHAENMIEYKFTFSESAASNEHTFVIKHLICKLLEGLKGHGWGIMTGFDMSRSLSSKTELLFQREKRLTQCKAFCLSPLMDGKVALINAPDNIVKSCRDVIESTWHLPIISQAHFDTLVTYDIFDLEGSPWDASKPDIFNAHALLCHVIQTFRAENYVFTLSADVIDDQIPYEGGNKLRHDPNSWWFLQEPEFSFGYQDFERPLSKAESVDDMLYMPSIGSVLRDDFTEPACPDYSRGHYVEPSSSPLVYEPFKTMGFTTKRSRSESNGETPMAPSYEKSLKENGENDST